MNQWTEDLVLVEHLKKNKCTYCYGLSKTLWIAEWRQWTVGTKPYQTMKLAGPQAGVPQVAHRP